MPAPLPPGAVMHLAPVDVDQGDVVALAFLADGKTLVSGSRDRTARIWDLATGRSTRMFPHANWVDTLSVSADGSLLATASAFPTWGEVYVWDLQTGERRHAWRVERAKAGASIPIRGVLALGRDGSSVTAAFGDGSLRRWDVSTGKERPIAQPKLEKLPRIGPGLDVVDRAVFSPDGRSVALIGGGCVQVMDVASGDRCFKEAVGSFGRPGWSNSPPTAGAWRSSGEAPARWSRGPIARAPRPPEHDRLARQPDGPRPPRDRGPRVLPEVPGVLAGRAIPRRRHLVVSPGAGDHPHLPAAGQAGDPDDRGTLPLDRGPRLHARRQADRRGPVGYVDRDLGRAIRLTDTDTGL